MTNMKGNRGHNGCKCAICGKRIRGILNWLCKEHGTKEYADIARKQQSAQ